ncbi:hypothetical protein A0128_17085 [Leptospira tipperaryensis]|uniref:Uncharacterized protein n=1 Tax=Leptospira tipperaryensis TaxID=2564040 RepID=A0A1D7V0P5_9LEPT|nr:hypothetical protein [Leptospira tipperaryensis]AOP35403.1 hypothetical protein A0128_17085 [Leptospira tipperaryensis]
MVEVEFDSNQYDLVLFVLLVISFCVGLFTILYSKNESINRGILLSTSPSENKGLRIPFDLLESFGFVSEKEKYRVTYKRKTVKIGVILLSESFLLLYQSLGITNDLSISLIKLVVFASIVIGLWVIVNEHKSDPFGNANGPLEIPDWRIRESVLELIKMEKVKIDDWDSFVDYFPYFAYLFPVENFEQDNTYYFTMNFENLYWINGFDQEVLSRLMEIVKESNGFFLRKPFPEKKKSKSKKAKRK